MLTSDKKEVLKPVVSPIFGPRLNICLILWNFPEKLLCHMKSGKGSHEIELCLTSS